MGRNTRPCGFTLKLLGFECGGEGSLQVANVCTHIAECTFDPHYAVRFEQITPDGSKASQGTPATSHPMLPCQQRFITSERGGRGTKAPELGSPWRACPEPPVSLGPTCGQGGRGVDMCS